MPSIVPDVLSTLSTSALSAPISKLPPTFKFLAIPAPPDTINAPVCVLVDSPVPDKLFVTPSSENVTVSVFKASSYVTAGALPPAADNVTPFNEFLNLVSV